MRIPFAVMNAARLFKLGFGTIYYYNTCLKFVLPAEPELLNITLQSEQFSNRNVTIVLDWMQENESMFHSYNISVVPEVEMIILFNRSTRAQLTLSYSVLYNITVGTTHPCPRIGVYHYGPLYYYYGKRLQCKFCNYTRVRSN